MTMLCWRYSAETAQDVVAANHHNLLVHSAKDIAVRVAGEHGDSQQPHQEHTATKSRAGIHLIRGTRR